MATDKSSPSSPENNLTLQEAWTRFGSYDINSMKARKRFVRQRKLILALTVASTTLAISYSVVERRLGTPTGPFFVPWLTQQMAMDIFHGLVVIAPILLTIMTAGAIRFNQGISWIMLRTSAEAIKKELFCYRMKVADYSNANTKTESRDMRLARKIKLISKRLMETQVNQTGLEAYKGPLPPAYGTDQADDGFSDLIPEQYLKWRVENQFNYYQKKSYLLSKELQHFQWLVYILGGLGTLLAAFGFDVWIAVSSALAAAFTGFLEFKRVETNVIACNLSAADLYDIRIWWNAMSPNAQAQQENIELLVASTERVLQTENAGWLQEMREALAEIYREKKEPDEEKVEHEDVTDRIFDAIPESGDLEEVAESGSPTKPVETATEKKQPTQPEANAAIGMLAEHPLKQSNSSEDQSDSSENPELLEQPEPLIY
jgi:hypothetical protein